MRGERIGGSNDEDEGDEWREMSGNDSFESDAKNATHVGLISHFGDLLRFTAEQCGWLALDLLMFYETAVSMAIRCGVEEDLV